MAHVWYSFPHNVRNILSVPLALTVISDVSAVPQDDRAFLVQWKNTDISSLIGYVVEWRPLLTTDLSLTQFEMTDRNQSSLIITGMFYNICVAPFKIHVHTYFIHPLFRFPALLLFLLREFKQSLLCKMLLSPLGPTRLYTLFGAYGPWSTLTSSLSSIGSFEPYKPYGISVYPRFKDGIGLPQTVNAYSRQKGKSPQTPGESHREQAEVWESDCLNFEEVRIEVAIWA